jgi:NAD(P)-dependent dehydrogenase (short-subunit alcohol dehydrogenase family)
MQFRNKVVFVAGGTSGINLGIAEAFAREGARLAVISRSSDNVERAIGKLRSGGAEATGFAADVRNFGAVSEALTNTAKTWGGIDIVISGAAGNFLAPAATMSANAFKSVVDIDLLGCFNVMRAAFEHLKKPGGCIVNITAPQAWLPTPLQIHACAAKAGVDQVTRTAAMEWGPLGIRVNGLAPGPIADTEGMRRLAPTADAGLSIVGSVPLRRYGKIAEIAKAALWLCSEDAAYITGAILPVDGGWSLGGSGSMTGALGPAHS